MDKTRRFGRCDGGSIPSMGTRAGSSMVEQLPLKQLVTGSNPVRVTNCSPDIFALQKEALFGVRFSRMQKLTKVDPSWVTLCGFYSKSSCTPRGLGPSSSSPLSPTF